MPRKKIRNIQEQINNKLETNVFNTKGEVVGKILLPKEIFSANINSVLMAQAVRVFLANQRLGTHSTKTRGEVSGSTRKIYRQKGTGRARHGDIKAPIFIGGGVATGPAPRNYSLDLNKKARKLALFSALTSKFQEGKVKIVAGLEKIKSKTKIMVEVLSNLNLTQSKKQKGESTLLILPETMKNIILAGRNLPGLSIIPAKLLNTYEVLGHQNLLFTKEAVTVAQEHFMRKSKISTDGKSTERVSLSAVEGREKKVKTRRGKKSEAKVKVQKQTTRKIRRKKEE